MRISRRVRSSPSAGPPGAWGGSGQVFVVQRAHGEVLPNPVLQGLPQAAHVIPLDQDDDKFRQRQGVETQILDNPSGAKHFVRWPFHEFGYLGGEVLPAHGPLTQRAVAVTS